MAAPFWAQNIQWWYAGDARLQVKRGCCKFQDSPTGKELAPQPCSLLSPKMAMEARLASDERSLLKIAALGSVKLRADLSEPKLATRSLALLCQNFFAR